MFCPKSKQYSVQKLSNILSKIKQYSVQKSSNIPLPLQYGDDQHVQCRLSEYDNQSIRNVCWVFMID